MKSNEFNEKAHSKVNELCKTIEALPWENVRFYNSWCAQTHNFVGHTSIFLNLCNERLPKDHPLKAQFEHHIEEEVGHEKMSENDLKFMHAEGTKVFEVTKAFWKTQYYWIKEVGPTAHLGYSLLLEGLAAKSGPKILKRVKAAGIQGYTFLKVHAEEDTEHFNDALKAVAKVSDKEREHIYQNLCEGMDMYIRIMNECVRESVQLAS
ncbi:iron-containing redox enzyme family protein [Bdellovibrio sp. HCB185ZH]|uniref:iron-containing redox enzyme family protein n=1 Tax=Bdellovibrio sp. HCB185ZH TaxID=3394235 RepID=UPI0039A6073E